MIEDEVEMEKDADSLKPMMAEYLETICDVVSTNEHNLGEIRRIKQKVEDDRVELLRVIEWLVKHEDCFYAKRSIDNAIIKNKG